MRWRRLLGLSAALLLIIAAIALATGRMEESSRGVSIARAVESGDHAGATHLLAMGADPNTGVGVRKISSQRKPERYEKLLHMAVMKGDREMVRLLLRHGAVPGPESVNWARNAARVTSASVEDRALAAQIRMADGSPLPASHPQPTLVDLAAGKIFMGDCVNFACFMVAASGVGWFGAACCCRGELLWRKPKENWALAGTALVMVGIILLAIVPPFLH